MQILFFPQLLTLGYI